MATQTIKQLLRSRRLCSVHRNRLISQVYIQKQYRHVHTKSSQLSEFIVQPHINIKAVLSDVNALQHNLQARNITNVDVQHIQQLYTKHTALQTTLQDLRAQRNKLSKVKPNSTTGVSASDVVEASKLLKQQIHQYEQEYSALEADLYNELYKLPNTISQHTPVGNESQYKVIDECNKRTYADNGINYIELCNKYNLVDFESAATTTGSRFVYLKNELALLEQALIQFTVHTLIQHGYTLVSTPDLIKTQYVEACGFIPRTTTDTKAPSQIYNIHNTDLSLIGTSEHCIAAMHSNQILKSVPLKYVAVSHCYRTESGSYGQASKGLYRLHQFSKVEMFVLCSQNDSDQIFDELIAIQRKLYDALQIHYRVIEIASGDLGASAHRKIDIESYMPYSRSDYGEISSTSNCTDYQSRRLNIRIKNSNNQSEYVHTLNGTGVAVPRMLISILEQHQYVDNNQTYVRIPAVLEPYMMNMDRIPSNIVQRR